MIKKYFYLILGFILLISAFLRVTRLDKIPPHLGNDEISIAFDSYSVRIIGKDEHGHSWPLSFESHQTYKAPLYAYLNMPLNWLFGNNEYGIRLLSAIFGIAAVFLIGFFGRFFGNDFLGLMAATILTLDPKAIFTSRIGFESNVAYAVMSLGVLFMFCFKKQQKKFFAILAGFFLGLSIWGYHTQWGLAPMLAIFLPFLSRKEIDLKKWLLMWLMLFLMAMPIFYNFIIVQRKDPNNRASSQIWFDEARMKDYLKNSKDNQIKKTIVFVMAPVDNYLQHFSLDSLFFSGSDIFNGESPLETGWFLWASLPLLIIGLFNLKKIFDKNTSWILSWWLLCPIVPATTYGGVASVRNLAFIIPTILIMAGGFTILIKKNIFWTTVTFAFLIMNFLIFSVAYFIHFPLDSGDNFQYGYKQAWEYIKPKINNYSQIIVEPKFGKYGQYSGVPHLYFGYFKAFPLEAMQKRIDKIGVKIDKFWFRDVDWNKEKIDKHTLYVVSIINPIIDKTNGELRLLTTIKKPNNDPQFLIYETIDNN